MKENNINLNKEHNKGMIKIDMNKVKDYKPDIKSKHGATKINFYDGESIIVADTVEQIKLRLKWKKNGLIDNEGNFVKERKKKKK